MARSISEIKAALLTQAQNDPVLGPLLTSSSRVAIYQLWLYIIAVCQWTIENLQDIFKADVNATIANMKPHSNLWYRNMALAFQYGYSLPADSDTYDNTGLTADQIAASQVIAFAAAQDAILNNRRVLRVKVAALVDGDLGPVPAGQLAAFTAYMARIKDAGVGLLITTGDPDALQLSIDFYYDPLILSSLGARNDGTDSSPIQTAIDTFLKSIAFNGVFSVNALDNALQAVEGYKDLRINYALVKYAALPYTSVNAIYTPDAGYLRVLNPATDLALSLIPYSE